ncbi:hypothetical protein CLD22_17835 [Rubrivivax gelatinosus]|nr:hypothetical protein [Rubrivivax gelatinosus]
MTSSVLPVAASAALVSPTPVQAGWGVSLTDLSAFNESLARAGQPLQAQHTRASSEAMKALFRPLEQINTEASTLSQHARAAMQAGSDLTPGEMVMLTVRCQEFLFHSQLTANVANRTSDGLQQLFRQQA